MEKKQMLILGGTFVVGVGLGYGAAYLSLKKKFQKISEDEIESVRKAYAKSALPKPDLDKVRSTFVPVEETDAESIIGAEGYSSDLEETDADAFRRAHGRVPSTEELILMGNGVEPSEAIRDRSDDPESGLVEGNVFDNAEELEPDPEDLGDEVFDRPVRTPDRPYVISAEEWYQNETNNDQITLVYWADDDVLSDDDQRMITDIESVVGATNLHRFGFMSDSPDVVYVRNERLKADYEITKDERNYSEVVHGIPPEAVNNSGVPRRMRSNDE